MDTDPPNADSVSQSGGCVRSSKPAVSMWSLNLSRDYGGERWKWPKVEVWRKEGTTNLRVGWRMTAWGIHMNRKDMTRPEADRVIAAAQSGRSGIQIDAPGAS